MRIKSEIWVRAYLRRCQSEGVPVVIVRRGDEAAGAIFICVDRLDGTVSLYGPAPAGLTGSDTERRWVMCFESPPSAQRKPTDISRGSGSSTQICGLSRSRIEPAATFWAMLRSRNELR